LDATFALPLAWNDLNSPFCGRLVIAGEDGDDLGCLVVVGLCLISHIVVSATPLLLLTPFTASSLVLSGERSMEDFSSRHAFVVTPSVSPVERALE
jgi:hypothetical protein